jgi:hypothetical protein
MFRTFAWNICRMPVEAGNVVWSYMTINTVEQREADAVIMRHRRWDWGEAATEQRRYNDRAALLGGTVQSVYSLEDGRRLHVMSFRCFCGQVYRKGTITLVCLSSEVLKFSRCNCMMANVPPHLWPESNIRIPLSVMDAWETILFHLSEQVVRD